MAAEIPPGRMLLAIFLILGGVLSAAVFLILTLTSAFKTLARVDAPGSEEVSLQPGDITLYWETPGLFVFDGFRGADLDLSVAPKGGGPPVSVSTSSLFVRYSTGDSRGYSIAEFTIDRPGDYTISAKAAAGKSLPRGSVVLKRSMGILGLLKLILITIVLLGGGVGGGVTLLVKPPKPASPAPAA